MVTTAVVDFDLPVIIVSSSVTSIIVAMTDTNSDDCSACLAAIFIARCNPHSV